MKSSRMVLVMTSALVALPLVAEAGRIDNRQYRQRKRVQQGEQSGEMTDKEAHRAKREQRKIETEKKEARSDGIVTPQERRDIRQDQNKASADIYRMKHNDQTRGAVNPPAPNATAPTAPSASAPIAQ